jgi:sugar phosphate permease
MGITNGIGQFGSFISPLIAGYLVVTLPDKSFDFSNVFIFWSICALVATICVAFLNDRSTIDHTEYENNK